jgi:hypothetical protein
MSERQHSGVDERVMHDDIGLSEACKRMQCEQAWVAGPCASKPDVTRLKAREPGNNAAQTVAHARHPSR